MTNNEEQDFLSNLEKKLWTSANKLLPSLDASQYKHVMLGLVFLKYVSDAFDIRRDELESQLRDPDQDYYLDPDDFGGTDSNEYIAEINSELEIRDYYVETNTFWVPQSARWQFLQNQNKVVINGVVWLTPEGNVLLTAPEDEAEKKSANASALLASLLTTPWKPLK